ncbi:single-stranded-DNA-specific exonuclease RecJ [Bacillus sp. CGMCC 1.16607]|uniref:single-stranded-DNA-specific exonuclease RecJ n=1 Tax=Bacillus sp. CGMCC 1.16607 TaxID=3351842 RepID=UPI00362D185B
MLHAKTRWNVRQVDLQLVNSLTKELNITPLVAQLLINRGVCTERDARSFLFGKEAFHDPFLLKDMDITVKRIKEAIERQEPILIFGDYDADGVSSTTVLMKVLTELGANVDFYIPNRFTEGYGPNEAAFRQAFENGIKLIITVDTGISALKEAKLVKELGVDLIITDHHEPGPELPDAFAIIHPKLEDSQYPFKELAGVGVAFKLAHALLGQVPEHLLEIAVIGTIADLVPLKDENRSIAKAGIQKLIQTNNVGLKALFKVCGIDPNTISEETIGFTLGPRINAAGRLGDADPAVQLLLTNDYEEAIELAEEIDQINRSRQSIVNEITEEAISMVEQTLSESDQKVLVIGKENWNAGVVGIVASRLVDKYYRPTIVLCYDLEKGLAKGSARSIEGFDLFQNLSQCKDILPHFGGHTAAAGMTLNLKDVSDLRDRLNELASQQLTEEHFVPVTNLDGEFQLEELQLDSIKEMMLLAPFGMDNSKPKILLKDANIANIRKIGTDQNHLKMTIEKNGLLMDGIGFGLGQIFDEISPSSTISVIGEVSINEWNNVQKPQIFLQDMAVDHWQMFDWRGNKQVGTLLKTLIQTDTKFILFNKENDEIFVQWLPKEKLIVIEDEIFARNLNLDMKNVVLLDFPKSKDLVIHLLSGKKPARLYPHLFKRDSAFFNTMPTREHFKWYYAFLTKKGPFDLKSYGDDLAKHRGWTRETIEFMSQVFFELDFATINNGFISLAKVAPKRDLTESKTYQQRQAQFSLENELLYSSFKQLKVWFEEIFQESVENREAIEEWI